MDVLVGFGNLLIFRFLIENIGNIYIFYVRLYF